MHPGVTFAEEVVPAEGFVVALEDEVDTKHAVIGRIEADEVVFFVDGHHSEEGEVATKQYNRKEFAKQNEIPSYFSVLLSSRQVSISRIN